MNIKKDVSSKILEKDILFNVVKKQLKEEYIGLDDVIDEICNLVEPWYLFPNAQLRPTIINLWGLTGVGKTSLIIRMFSLLGINNLLKFDTGEWVDKDDFQLTEKISGQLNKLKKDNMIPIFVFDEFQLGRTKNEIGVEIDRTSLRVVWDLLDSGKFNIIEEKWETSSIMKLYKKLQYLLYDKNVIVKCGRVTNKKEDWDLIFVEEDSDEMVSNDITEIINKYYSEDAFIPSAYLYTLRTMNDDIFYSEVEVAKYLLTLSGDEILTFIEKSIVKSTVPIEHDFSDSIIFIIGNLDKAYYNSDEMDPDVDADSLYEHTKKITLSDIKKTLTHLYRPEQISRLGNNHVIYKSFNKKMYQDIIKMELNKIVDRVSMKFDFNINFDSSINDLIYTESVFPTQGVRPIFSTITSLIESYIGRIVVNSLKNKLDIISLNWSYLNEEYIIKLNTTTVDKILKYKVVLKIDNVRKSKTDDMQALVGIHEAGHVITSIYALNLLPRSVLSRTANGNGGVTFIDLPDYETKELLINSIIMLIGGYTAEKMIFGDNNLTSGSYSDLEHTTKTALKIVKEYGMNGIPLQFSTPDFRISDSSICLNNDDLDLSAIELVKKCQTKTEQILNDNMVLLLRMGEYLTNNSKMNSDEIKKMVEKYGSKKPIYKTKDNYFDYKKVLMDKIKKI